MAKYTEHFHFEPQELALIEDALRREIKYLSREDAEDGVKPKVREINTLLAKIFHQKKFYSQVNPTGVPAG